MLENGPTPKVMIHILGKCLPGQQTKIHRCRVSNNIFLKLFHYMESQSNAQQYTFGTKLLLLSKGGTPKLIIYHSV